MTEPATDLEPHEFLLGPLLCWLAINLAALAIGAAGVPLSAKPFIPPESASLAIVAVVQVASAALLWPILFRSRWGTVGVICTSIPFLQAAGFLSATSGKELLTASFLVCAWFLTLAVIRIPKSDGTFMISARLLTAIWCIAGAIIVYLRAEFSHHAQPISLGPIVQILSALQGENALPYFVIDGIILLLTIVARVAHHVTTKREAS